MADYYIINNMEEIIITKEYLKSIFPKREQNSHKGTFGNVLNIVGSVNYRGAAFLSTKAVLKAGAGYVELASVDKVINSVSNLCPEAVFIPLKQTNGTIKKEEYKTILELLPKIKTLLFGCGISSINKNQEDIEIFVQNLTENIKNITIPVIIDADGINIISRLNITDLPEKTILTPHPNELSRLLKTEVSEIQNNRIKYAKIAAKKYKSVIVLKGQNTVITDGDKVFLNKTGNSSLAKAGTGDVLSGIIAGFCAQGVNIFGASITGVYLHGLSGEIASDKMTEYSVNASELMNFIPLAIKEILL